MELHHLHVGDLGPGPPADSHAVARGDVWIAGVEIDLAAAPGGEDRPWRADGEYLSRLLVEQVGADAAVASGEGEATRRDEVDEVRPLPDLHVRQRTHLCKQAGHYLAPGDVAGMEDAAHCVSALASKVVAAGPITPVEYDAVLLQFAYALWTCGDDLADRRLVAQPRAGVERVSDMALERVFGIDHARNAALGVVAVAVGGALLRHQQDAPAMLGEVYRAHQPRYAASRHQAVAIDGCHRLHWVLMIIPDAAHAPYLV